MAKKTKKVTMKPKKKGQKKVTFNKGGLHKSLGVPQGQKIPEHMMQEAKMGKHGYLAMKQANMAMGMLKQGRKTAAKNKRRK